MDGSDGLSSLDSPVVAGIKLKDDVEGSRAGVRRVVISSNKAS